MQNPLECVTPYTLPANEYKAQQGVVTTATKELSTDVESLNDVDFPDIEVRLPEHIEMQTDPKYQDMPFGARGTVSSSGCLAFVAYLILQFGGFEYSISQIVDCIVNKHYRIWKLMDRPKLLDNPICSVEVIKKEFPNDADIQNATNLEEISKVAGSPWGVGGAAIFMDRLIAAINKTNGHTTEKYAFRLNSVEELLRNLEDGIPVPCRVENSIYHADPNRKGGHYVVWFGIKDNTAIVVDSNFGNGIRFVPIEQFLKSLIGTKSLTCAWDLRSIA